MDVGLTQGKVARIDAEDWPLVGRYKWHAACFREGGKEWWYARTNIGGRQVRMHHLITCAKLVDHRDGDGLNNRRGNLRPCTQAQNMANTGSRGGTSKFKGVSWRAGKGKWGVAFSWERKTYFVGYFARDREIEAALACDAAIRPLAGEFARLNFPV
jgi:hypothetical protein